MKQTQSHATKSSTVVMEQSHNLVGKCQNIMKALFITSQNIFTQHPRHVSRRQCLLGRPYRVDGMSRLEGPLEPPVIHYPVSQGGTYIQWKLQTGCGGTM